MSDISEGLKALVARGFKFLHPRDSTGVVAVIGIRPHHDVIDVVQLLGEQDATAVRMPGNEDDVLFPHTVLYRTSGSADQVISSFLALPEPEAASDSASHGCWVPARPGQLTWLPASA
jgi:hypothetical protein